MVMVRWQKPSKKNEIDYMKWTTDGTWITTKQVADIYGVTPRRIRQIAASRGVEGRRVGRMLVWTAEEVKKMAPRKAAGPGHQATALADRLGGEIREIIRAARIG